MKNRKRIAVLMAGVVHSYQHLFLKGILSQAKALNYDVCIFSPFMSYENETDYQLGENQIFDLIDYDIFDGVIYAPCSFTNDHIRQKVEERLDKLYQSPVVALEYDDPRYACIMVDDVSGFEQLVSHLIEQHHLKKIICLTGYKDNMQAEMRLQGYRNAMQSHELEIPEEYVIYGDFWKAAALQLAEDIAESRIEKPEAVVCCCDTSAIALCNKLVELGFRVPEDIVVAGYDAGKDASENVPSVTTYSRPIVDMGVNGVLRLHELLTGEQAEPVTRDSGYLVPAESCGCGGNFTQRFRERQKEICENEDLRQQFENIPMAERLNSMPTLKALFDKILDHLYLVHDLCDFYLCMCDHWDDLSKNSGILEDYNHYTEKMHLRISCTDNRGEVKDEIFPLSDLLPILHADRQQPRAYYFTPLHFNERCLGYTVISYGERFKCYDSVYHNWTRNLNNAFEFMRVKNNFSSINQRLFKDSVRDSLTGIYNRNGYQHYSEKIFAKAQTSEHKKLLLLAVDLDGLKVINDTYGHLEGDNAISVVANALNTCFSLNEICARTGGDEFLVIGCDDYNEQDLQEYQQYILDFLEQYNAESGKPYPVEVSLGFLCQEITQNDSLQNLADEADSRMYANKIRRKKQRTA
ncbi:MAG: GGDEF domain-containing protein [Ruminococcus sp.]|nr:GGDEF domain-containing protein [Ruminococcus sp.]